MDPSSLVGPAVVAALVSGAIAIVGVVVNRSTTFQVSESRLKADRELAERRFVFDMQLAERKFAQEKAQIVHKRRFELAEVLLAEAYQFRELVRYVRTSATFGSEGESRKSDTTEPADIKRSRDSYFVPIERLQKHSEFVSAFFVKEHAARAHFGADAAKAFEVFGRVINDVQTASNILIEMEGQSKGDPNFIRKMREDIWSHYSKVRGNDDAISKSVDDAVSLIENHCRPALEWSGEA